MQLRKGAIVKGCNTSKCNEEARHDAADLVTARETRSRRRRPDARVDGVGPTIVVGEVLPAACATKTNGARRG